jgi:peroxiredoxin
LFHVESVAHLACTIVKMANHQVDPINYDGKELMVKDFCLPDMKGSLVSAEHLRKKGAIVIIFCVGGLCPVNSITLLRFLKVLPELEGTGASLVAISCEKSKEYHQISQQSPSFYFLLDASNQFLDRVSEKAQATNFPAIFAVGPEGDVLFSSLDSNDTSKRILPNDVIATLSGAVLTNDSSTPSWTDNSTPKASKPARRSFMKIPYFPSPSSK